MKKLGFIALLCVAGIAFASSLSVPWFIDQNNVNAGWPPSKDGIYGHIYLKNNLPQDLPCWIEYYTQDGDFLPLTANTFTIPANSTVSFRPCVDDPLGTATGGGQETTTGLAVPNRPRTSTIGQNGAGMKFNGSCVVRWLEGGDGAVQGMLVQNTRSDGGNVMLQFGTLLPPGVSN